MSRDGVFVLAADLGAAHQAALELFEATRLKLVGVLPLSAEVLHVGATAIPGCLTKGDLDIVVRVDLSDFAAAQAELSARFAHNSGSICTEHFAAFEDQECVPHLGIQLVAKDSALDVFHRFAEALRDSPSLVQHYNGLKSAHHGQPMAEYRAAKDVFIEDVLRLSLIS